MNLHFGEVENMAWWTVAGKIHPDLIENVGRELSELVGMILHGEPKISHFPTYDGKGGEGLQGYFEWVESWLIIGTWPELNKVRIAMSTCAIDKFIPLKITQFLEMTIGKVIKYGCVEW